MRKLGRGKSSDDDPHAESSSKSYSNIQASLDDRTSEETLVSRPQRTQRAESEPSEQLLSSIPSHIPLNYRPTISRNVSDADYHSSSSSNPQLLLPNESKVATAPVESLGLSLLHRVQNADIDFIFIHGLGGSSLRSWSFRRDSRHFWPLWLPREPELSHARIFTFGYNADFRGGSTSFNITDFAKDLLFQMLTFTDETNGDAITSIGEVRPIHHEFHGLVVDLTFVSIQ